VSSRGKKKTTFAKLARESRLRERRIDKQAKKDARKRVAEPESAHLGDATHAGESTHSRGDASAGGG